jgi:N utilization substance protein B
VLANKETIDTWIKADLNEDWSISRIARIDLSILRVCLYEYKIKAEIPLKIVANEAVEIAKKYGTNSSANFVNGLLGGISTHFDEEDKSNDENNINGEE